MTRNKRTGALELKCALIAFHNVTGRHDGVNLARIVLALLDRAGVTSKVCCVGNIWRSTDVVILVWSLHPG